MAQHLSEGCSLSPTTDKDRFGPRMEEKRRMHQGVMVDVFISFCRLSLAVEYQASPKCFSIQDIHSLIRGFTRMNDVIDAIKHHQISGYQFKVPSTRCLHNYQLDKV